MPTDRVTRAGDGLLERFYIQLSTSGLCFASCPQGRGSLRLPLFFVRTRSTIDLATGRGSNPPKMRKAAVSNDHPYCGGKSMFRGVG